MIEKRLSSIGRLPSDIDGDITLCKCRYCGRNLPSDSLKLRIRNGQYECTDCTGEMSNDRS